MVIKTCPICQTPFTLNHPHQKYCTPQCQITSRKQQIKNNVQRYRQKWRQQQKQELYEAIQHASHEHGQIIYDQYHNGKGTGSLGPEPHPDFHQEQLLIQKEKRRLKLKI